MIGSRMSSSDANGVREKKSIKTISEEEEILSEQECGKFYCERNGIVQWDQTAAMRVIWGISSFQNIKRGVR